MKLVMKDGWATKCLDEFTKLMTKRGDDEMRKRRFFLRCYSVRHTKSGSRSFTTAETGNRFRFHNVLKIYFLFILSCNFPICFPFSLEFSERWAELGCWCEGVFLVRIGMEFWVICDKCLIYFIFLTYCGFYLLNLEFCFRIFDLFLCELT